MPTSIRSYNIPGYSWLAFLIGIVIYEVWALKTGNYTLSAWVWEQDLNFPWFKWVVMGGFVGLAFHFFFQRGFYGKQ
jgi:hypothetical protein